MKYSKTHGARLKLLISVVLVLFLIFVVLFINKKQKENISKCQIEFSQDKFRKITAIAYSPDGKYFAYGKADCRIVLLSANSRENKINDIEGSYLDQIIH